MIAELKIDEVTFLKVEAEVDKDRMIKIMIRELLKVNNTDKFNTSLNN